MLYLLQLCSIYSSPSPLSPGAFTGLFPVPTVLSFPEWHTVAYRMQPFQTSFFHLNVHFRLLHVFPWLDRFYCYFLIWSLVFDFLDSSPGMNLEECIVHFIFWYFFFCFFFLLIFAFIHYFPFLNWWHTLLFFPSKFIGGGSGISLRELSISEVRPMKREHKGFHG